MQSHYSGIVIATGRKWLKQNNSERCRIMTIIQTTFSFTEQVQCHLLQPVPVKGRAKGRLHRDGSGFGLWTGFVRISEFRGLVFLTSSIHQRSATMKWRGWGSARLFINPSTAPLADVTPFVHAYAYSIGHSTCLSNRPRPRIPRSTICGFKSYFANKTLV